MEPVRKKNKVTMNNQLISLAKIQQEWGLSSVSMWRYRKRGWLKGTVTIGGRIYLPLAAYNEFVARAQAGEFAQIRAPRPQKKSQ